MRISDAARASGCHLETIRYYERIGLLDKAARNTNGYRHYKPTEVARLKFIARGRELGFSLEEIRSLIALAEQTNMPCGDIDRLASKHLADIEARIGELQRMATELRRTIRSCAGGVRARCAILGDLQASGESLGADSHARARRPRVRSPGAR